MQEEKYNCRDRSYSAWHRRNSTRRFIGIEKAQLLAMIDLDAALYIEYDDKSKEPLALVETARDVGQDFKNATVTLNLAKKAGIPCYVLLYELSSVQNPSDTRVAVCGKKFFDVERFRIKRLYPHPEKNWRTLTPQEWADGLVKLRVNTSRKVDKEWAETIIPVPP